MEKSYPSLALCEIYSLTVNNHICFGFFGMVSSVIQNQEKGNMSFTALCCKGLHTYSQDHALY